MNNRIKFGIGLVLGLLIAMLALWKFGPGWTLASVFAVAGIICIVAGRKFVSCFLASCMFVSPTVLADDINGNNYAGYDGQLCYCWEPTALDPDPPAQEVFAMDFDLEANGDGIVQPHVLSMRHPDPSTLVGYDDFNASLAPWGINLENGEQYAKNGQPATFDQVPFAFGGWETPIIIYPDREQYRVVVEVSKDPGTATWNPIAQFSLPAGVRVTFMDSPEGGQTFYRVRMEPLPPGFRPAAGPIMLGCGLGLLIGAGVVCVLTVRACARNKKKFEKMLPPKETNDPPAELRLKLN